MRAYVIELCNDSIKPDGKLGAIEYNYAVEDFLRESTVKETINENDGDDMSIYKELDDKVIHICYSHNFNVQTRVGNDRAYYG